MITPFGRFRWVKLPFRLKVSSQIFQRKINEVLGDIFIIADVIIVAGCGNSEADAKADNKAKLKAVFEQCREQNLTKTLSV